jgi:DNA repair protein RecN (Recombination protein N)
MLTRLQVKNYVLLDSLEIDFPEGLIIITGQTGAGKSILLGALSLVAGAKADASMLSEGADNCVVEAEFTIEDQTLREVLEENEVDCEDNVLIVRRVVNRSGRSRAFINDCPVPVQVLQDISSRLIDIHSQHQTLLLSDRRFQMSLLDFYAGNSGLLEESAGLWKLLQEKKAELRTLEERLSRSAAERDYNQARLAQLQKASLKEGELAELEQEQKQLANAEEIKTSFTAVEEMFASASAELSLDGMLKESSRLLSRLGRYVPQTSELAERVDSCRHELDDILSEIIRINQRTEHSAERLEEVEERMSLIYGLMQRFSCQNESELISVRDSMAAELFDSSALEEKKLELLAEISSLSDAMNGIADRLHESRKNASEAFARQIEDSIRFLELPYAIFEVGLERSQLTANGYDQVTFRFSSTGRNAVDISKCASGGEMSRIMLALKAMCAEYTDMPTMIFDEIDTGVSGSVADKMGSMICKMGTRMQVFAITHLPQVAAKGNAHYLVRKEIDPVTSKAVTSIGRLGQQERIMEVARMLSGSSLTEAAIANAKSLLSI